MRKRFEELRLTGRLPSPSSIGVRILHLLKNDDYDAGELARTIQSDPALAGRILKMANSVRFGGVRAITSISEAVIRLGLHPVRNIALGFSLVSNHREGRCRRFDYDRYWSESLARAIAAQRLAEELRTVPTTEAYLCGLLSGIGRLALATVHPSAYSDILAKLHGDDACELADAEQAAFAIDHGEVAFCMLRDWQIPESHCNATADFWRPNVRIDELPEESRAIVCVLRAASCLASILVDEDPASQNRRYPSLEQLRPSLAMPASSFDRLCDEVAARWGEWGRLLGIRTRQPPEFQTIRQRSLDVLDDPDEPISLDSPLVLARDRDETVLPVDERPFRVLIALSEEDDGRRLQEWLASPRRELVVVSNAEELIRSAIDLQPDTVLIAPSIGAPGPVEACRRLRITECGTRAYIALLCEQPSDITAALDAGADDVVVAPLRAALVSARIACGERLADLRRRIDAGHLRSRRLLESIAELNREIGVARSSDSLTELRSQLFAAEKMKRVWPQPTTSPLSLAMFRIDGLGDVNRDYGRFVGDQVVADVAGLMRAQKRSTDLLCRLGGSVLGVFCRTDPDGAVAMAKRFRRVIESHTVRLAVPATFTVSVGIATRAAWMTSPDDLLRAAEATLREAVAQGGNRIVSAGDLKPPGAQNAG